MKPEDLPEHVRQAFEDALADAMLAGLNDGPGAKEAEQKGIEKALGILVDHFVDEHKRQVLADGLRQIAEDMRPLVDYLDAASDAPAEPVARPTPSPPLAPTQFRCAQCGETFEKGVPDEEALAERDENGWSEVECDLVCDDCYKEVMAWAAEKGLP